MAAIKERKVPKKKVTNRPLTASLARKIKTANTENWIYVSPKGNMWSVRKDGAEKAMRTYKLKSSALSAAKKIVQLNGNRHIIIYNSQGEISRIVK